MDTILKFTWNYLYKTWSKEDDKKHILEPLSTILKLALISFEEEGTKIAISNNSVVIQRPTILQGTIRYINGNNREEIHYLLKPIIRCIELYSANTDPNVRYIYDLAIDGLEKLKRSYGSMSSNVCYTIDLYITVLRGSHDIKLTDTESQDNMSIFKDIWDERDVGLLASLLSASYLMSVQDIIDTKEKKFGEVLKNTIY
jgi:hypothetical protein